MRRLALAVLGAVAAGLPVASAAPRDIELVSRQSSDDGGAAADSSSHATAVSADGRYVAFETFADNLYRGEVDAVHKVFRRDTATGRTELVSRASGPGGEPIVGAATAPAISADGRYVAFESTADNLSRADDRTVGYFENVFVRDMETAATVLVSRADGPRGRHDGAAGFPAVSPDGRYVAFSSFAPHMSRVDRDEAVDVFLRDLRAKRTILVSPRSGTGRGAFDPAISRRGRFVAFRFQAARRGIVDCRVRDIRRRRTVVVTVSSDGAAADRDCLTPSISADGRYVAFASRATNLARGDGPDVDVFVRDLRRGRTVQASDPRADSGSFVPSLSADGRFVAFVSRARSISDEDRDDVADVFLRDLRSGRIVLVSGSRAEGANADSRMPSTAGHGRAVAFLSKASNLSPLDVDDHSDVFLARP